jgi:hypothetical protein
MEFIKRNTLLKVIIYGCLLCLSVLLYLASSTTLFSQYYDPVTVSDQNPTAKYKVLMNNYWLRTYGITPSETVVTKKDLLQFYEDQGTRLSARNGYRLVRRIRDMKEPFAKVGFIEGALIYYEAKRCRQGSSNTEAEISKGVSSKSRGTFCSEIADFLVQSVNSLVAKVSNPAIYRGDKDLQAVYTLDIGTALLRRNEYFKRSHPRIVLQAQANNYVVWRRLSNNWNRVVKKIGNPEVFEIERRLPKMRQDIEELLTDDLSFHSYLKRFPAPIRS